MNEISNDDGTKWGLLETIVVIAAIVFVALIVRSNSLNGYTTPTDVFLTPTPESFQSGLTTANLNLRADPNPSAPILAVIPGQTTLVIMDGSENWYRVAWEGLSGWVSARYVKIIQSFG